MRRAKVDENQKVIVAALRAAGASVQPLHEVGKGCPDLLVGVRGVTHLLEVKSEANRRGQKKETTDRQQAWHDSWRGVPPVRVYTVEEALKAVGLGSEYR